MVAKFSLYFWISFISAVGLGSLVILKPVSLFIVFAIIAIGICSAIFRINSLIYICIILCGLIFGINAIINTFEANEFEQIFGQSIDAQGVVSMEPPITESNQQITIKPNGYNQSLRASLYQPIPAHKGDKVWVRGYIAPPENFDGFDYIGYLQRYNVYASLKKPHVIVLKPGKLTFGRLLLSLKLKILEKFGKSFHLAGGLIEGMLIGEKGRIPKQVIDDFKTTGLSHVIAVSGYNMTIIASFCATLAWYLGRRWSGIATILILICFASMAGGGASIVRAAIMALLTILAQLTGRMYTSVYALVWAAGLMVLQNPRIVVWDIGFQLSVAATLGVLVAYKLKNPEKPETFFWDIMRPTIGAIFATTPIIAMQFNTLSLISPLANAVFLPLVPWIMLFGALSIFPFVGEGFALIADNLASLMIKSVHTFASIPYANVNIKISWINAIIYYLFAIVIVIFMLHKRRKRVLF